MIIDDYEFYINRFKTNKYESVFFSEFNSKNKNQLLLRHDVDQDCSIAHELSIVERKLNVKSTYFFLLSNNSYNLISSENIKIVNKIKNNGHKISLHFDPTIYENITDGLKKEINIFEQTFNEKVNIISYHRPPKKYLAFGNKKILNITSTYDDKFFNKTKYFSDSRGRFNYGNPLDSDEFKKGLNIQLLTHPIWWIGGGNNVNERLKWFKKHKIDTIEKSLSDNLDFYGK